MPYISENDRNTIEYSSEFTGVYGLAKIIEKMERLRSHFPGPQSVGYHPGTLNYIITRLCDFWCRDNSGEANYERYNSVIGVLECVKQELYRRQVAPYEDKKCEQNGDVYDHHMKNNTASGGAARHPGDKGWFNE